MPFADFIGQEAAVRLLALTASEPGQAPAPLLLEGPEGSGRSEAARRLAGALHGASEPVLDVSGCVLSMDDAAGDEKFPVRELSRWLSHTATSRRAAVISLHGASEAAQNALLKCLEEPAALTHLLLVAGESEALPTIASRCLRVRFHALGAADLERIASRAGAEIPAGLAELAAGSCARLDWLSEHPHLAGPLQAASAGPLLASLSQEPDATARRAWCRMAIPALAAADPARAPGCAAAMAELAGGLRPEACLALALLN